MTGTQATEAREPGGRFRDSGSLRCWLAVVSCGVLGGLGVWAWWTSDSLVSGSSLLWGGLVALAGFGPWMGSLFLERRLRASWRGRQEGRHRVPTRLRHATLEDLRRGEGSAMHGLAHELRTPLNALRGFSSLLAAEMEGPLPAEVREVAEAMDGAARRLETLVEEVIELVEGRADQIPVRRVPVEVARLLRRVIRETSPLAPEGVLLRVDATDDALCVWADAARLLQVLVNLTVNALQCVEEGDVTLAARRRGEEVEIVVGDRGPGISDLDRLVRPFERGEGSGGEGLGLAIVRHLVMRQGGKLLLAPRRGGGNEWRVVLPAAPREVLT